MRETLLWDGYGLSNPFSGIGRHAVSLKNELEELGVVPVLVHPNFISELNLPTLLHSPQSFGKLGMVQSRSRFLKNLDSRTPVVTHGLSNFNVLDHPQSYKVLTIHDLIPLLSSKLSVYSLQMAYLLPKAIEIADLVICVSRWTQDSCCERFPQYSKKFIYIPNGLNSQNSIVSRETCEEKHVLAVSRWESYKGFDRILAIASHLQHSAKFHWVTDHKGMKWIKSRAAHLVHSGHIKIYLGLTDKELSNLYKQASVLIHCSEFEGYCLPASEAISFDVPILYRRGSGIDEVVGMAGLGMTLDDSISSWCDALIDMIQKNSTWRQKVRQERKCKPSWTEVAKQTLSVYNKKL